MEMGGQRASSASDAEPLTGSFGHGHSHSEREARRRLVALIAGCYTLLFIAGIFLVSAFRRSAHTPTSVSKPHAAAPSLSVHAAGSGSYPGPLWRTNQTLGAVTLLENKWMRVESHRVRTEDGQTVDDWVWMDVIDQVNVLVHLRHNNKFAVFKQKKYVMRIRRAIALKQQRICTLKHDCLWVYCDRASRVIHSLRLVVTSTWYPFTRIFFSSPRAGADAIVSAV
jgi:hypothetical protein